MRHMAFLFPINGNICATGRQLSSQSVIVTLSGPWWPFLSPSLGPYFPRTRWGHLVNLMQTLTGIHSHSSWTSFLEKRGCSVGCPLGLVLLLVAPLILFQTALSQEKATHLSHKVGHRSSTENKRRPELWGLPGQRWLENSRELLSWFQSLMLLKHWPKQTWEGMDLLASMTWSRIIIEENQDRIWKRSRGRNYEGTIMTTY